MKKNYIKTFVFALLCIFINSNLNAQNIEKLDGDVWEGCIIKSKPFSGHAFVPRPNIVAYNMDNRIMPCATFVVNYNGFSPEAEAAFQYAVDIWANLIDSPIQITVSATFQSLDAGVLGQAGPTGFLVNEPEFLPNTAYAQALGESIIEAEFGTIDPIIGGSVDITASFNSDRTDWYYGTDGNTPMNEIDFVTVVLHELGHGLGLLGFGRVDDNDNPTEGRLLNGGFVHIWDQFIESSGSAITSYPDPSVALLDEYTGGALTCTSALATAQNGGATPIMYAPATWDGGSSYSHWNESTYPNSNPNALMTPFLSDGVAIHNPGDMTLGFMQDMGWNICPGALNANQFDVVDFTISPNPFVNRVSVQIANGSLQSEIFDIQLIDINGRIVFSSESTVNNSSIEINDLESLSPALYFLKITGQTSGSSITEKVIKN